MERQGRGGDRASYIDGQRRSAAVEAAYTIGLSVFVFKNVAMVQRLVSCEQPWLSAILPMASESVIYIRRRYNICARNLKSFHSH